MDVPRNEEDTKPTPLTNHTAICADDPPWSPDEAQVAAAAFLARYNGRTLEAYRHDLRYYFQWATDQHLAVLDASRAHIEIYRSMTEQRGLAASTIDRLLSTVCGYYRFAHIDGRIPANPAQYVRRPKVEPTEQHAMDRGELGRFLFTAENYDRPHAALASAQRLVPEIADERRQLRNVRDAHSSPIGATGGPEVEHYCAGRKPDVSVVVRGVGGNCDGGAFFSFGEDLEEQLGGVLVEVDVAESRRRRQGIVPGRVAALPQRLHHH